MVELLTAIVDDTSLRSEKLAFVFLLQARFSESFHLTIFRIQEGLAWINISFSIMISQLGWSWIFHAWLYLVQLVLVLLNTFISLIANIEVRSGLRLLAREYSSVRNINHIELGWPRIMLRREQIATFFQIWFLYFAGHYFPEDLRLCR